MNEHERHLLEQLLNSGQSRGQNRPLLRTACEFVIENGWWYTPIANSFPKATQGECFKNAFDLASDNKALTYVEGYALLGSGARTAHAWVADSDGHALDPTWPTPGVAYAGVPFSIGYVTLSLLRNHAVVCLIDDYLNDWPLLREAGNNPAEWLASGGQGRERISATKPGKVHLTCQSTYVNTLFLRSNTDERDCPAFRQIRLTRIRPGRVGRWPFHHADRR